MNKLKGGFTLPGEAGYEKLTLELAETWGADVIRDSDGTVLSNEITDAGYGIYSTICIIRDHNIWAKKNMDKLQQTFLCTQPHTAYGDTLELPLMADFFDGQFSVNTSDSAMRYWQVFDRTDDTELPSERWIYNEKTQAVIIAATPWHTYTVTFLAYRIWEEISMYNHTTNNWDKEHLMQIDPIHPAAQTYLLDWMEKWCESHPKTTVVRFTSLFYNFVWIWGSNSKNRHLFTDWASYDFTVSPLALDIFAEKYGYRMTGEDFINKGKHRATHCVPDKKKRDWMAFVNDFVITFGKKLIDTVHCHGKQAYVFYDDSWVGIEPYGDRFTEFGFDGIIKCVFSGYEARLCAGVKTTVHEIRLHPYLFPVGLGGAPTFMEGGDPARDAKQYWISVRRALLREGVDRIGLGGYLHLVEDFPDFVDCVKDIAGEFRMIRELHATGRPYTLKPKVAVLHAWGRLRSWTLSGHFHETYMHDLIHIIESLSGLPFDVSFISFDDVENGRLSDFDVIINAGYQKSAWNGDILWKNSRIIENLTRWVYEGGALIGVNEPSATDGYSTLLRMAHVFGVDLDTGERVCHGKWSFMAEPEEGLHMDIDHVHGKKNLYLTDGNARVLVESEGVPLLTVNRFGKGKGIYMPSYEISRRNTRFLLNLILYAAGESLTQDGVTDNYNVDCAYYPQSGKLIAVNSGDAAETAEITLKGRKYCVDLPAYEMAVIEVQP